VSALGRLRKAKSICCEPTCETLQHALSPTAKRDLEAKLEQKESVSQGPVEPETEEDKEMPRVLLPTSFTIPTKQIAKVRHNSNMVVTHKRKGEDEDEDEKKGTEKTPLFINFDQTYLERKRELESQDQTRLGLQGATLDRSPLLLLGRKNESGKSTFYSEAQRAFRRNQSLTNSPVNDHNDRFPDDAEVQSPTATNCAVISDGSSHLVAGLVGSLKDLSLAQ
jgi:hypothetical protein